jgi:oligosaccharide repeat unit polymerase
MEILMLLLVAGAALFPWFLDFRRYRIGALFAPSAFLALYCTLRIVGLDLYILSIGISGPDFSGLTSEESARLFVRANGVIFLYLLCWSFAYRRVLDGAHTEKTAVVAPAGLALSKGVLAVLTLVLAGLVFVLALALKPENTSRSAYTAGAEGKALFFAVACLFAAATTYFCKVCASKWGWYEVLSVALVAFGAFVALAALGGRARALTVFIYLLVIVHYSQRPVSIRACIAALVLLLGAAMGYSLYERGGVDASRAQTALAMVPYVMYDKTFSRNFDFVENVSLLLRAFDEGRMTFTYGINAVADVLRDLSIATPIQDTRTLFLQRAFGEYDVPYGHAITKPGEGYLSAGLLGVAFYGTLYGFLSGLVFKHLVIRRSLGEFSVAAYITLLIQFGLADPNGYVWGSLVLATTSVVVLILIAALSLGYMRVRIYEYDAHEWTAGQSPSVTRR